MQDLDVVVLDLLLTKAGIATYIIMKDSVLSDSKMNYVIMKMNICRRYMLRNLHILKFTKNYLLQPFNNSMTTTNFYVIYKISFYFHNVNKIKIV